MNSQKRGKQKEQKLIEEQRDQIMTFKEFLQSIVKNSANFNYDKRKDFLFENFFNFIEEHGFKIEEKQSGVYALLDSGDNLIIPFKDMQEFQMFICGAGFAEKLIFSALSTKDN